MGPLSRSDLTQKRVLSHSPVDRGRLFTSAPTTLLVGLLTQKRVQKEMGDGTV